MDIFTILKNIYTSRNSKWIKDLEDSEISPLIINRFLSMNNKIISQCDFLNRYTFRLKPRSFLYLAWATIPKYERAPFCPNIKKNKEEDNYEELWIKIRKVLEMGDNDFACSKQRLLETIEKDKDKWFKMFGMNKKFWDKHGTNFSNIRDEVERKGPSGLEMFGL